MRRTILALTAAGLLAATAGLSGQTPQAGQPAKSGAQAKPGTPVSQPPAAWPQPKPVVGGWVAGNCAPGAPTAAKACVTEPKATTCTVYGSLCKEYCAPRCTLHNMLAGWFGEGCCETCDGCELKYKRVLTKKVVPGPEVPACVIKDVPVVGWCPAPAATPGPHLPNLPHLLPSRNK
jgi:hypothetical protein